MGFFIEWGVDRNNRRYVNRVKYGRIIVAVIVGLLAIIALLGSLYTVDAGEHGVVYNGVTGSLRETGPGTHFKLPIVESVYYYDLRSQLYTEDADASSADLQSATTSITVLYHLDPGYVTWIHQHLGPGVVESKVVQPSVREAVKNATAHYNATDLIQERPLVRDQIQSIIETRLGAFNVIIDQVSITNFKFSDEFNKAIEAKVIAKQQADQAFNNLSKVENDAQQPVIRAKANLTAAEYNAQATIVTANAQGAAARAINLNLTSDYLTYLRIRAWDGRLPTTLFMGNGNASVLLDARGSVP